MRFARETKSMALNNYTDLSPVSAFSTGPDRPFKDPAIRQKRELLLPLAYI